MLWFRSALLTCLLVEAACTTSNGKKINSGERHGNIANLANNYGMPLSSPNSCEKFSSNTGIRVTRREHGRAVEGIIRVLGGKPGMELYVIGPFNQWGQQKTPSDRLLWIPGTPYYEGRIRQLQHGMEYRLLADGKSLIDPSAVGFTQSPDMLNSIFWDFSHPDAFSSESKSIDLEEKFVVMAQSDALSLVQKFPRNDGGAGPLALNQTYSFVAKSGVIKELRNSGYNAIKLSSVQASRDGERWYDREQVFGFFSPDPRFGTPDDFGNMIKALQDAGVAVIAEINIDYYATAGGTGDRNLSAVGLQQWKRINDKSLFGDEVLSDGEKLFDYSSPFVEHFLIDSAIHLVCRYGLSGISFTKSRHGNRQVQIRQRHFLAKKIVDALRMIKPNILVMRYDQELLVQGPENKFASPFDLIFQSDFSNFLNHSLTKSTIQFDGEKLERHLRRYEKDIGRRQIQSLLSKPGLDDTEKSSSTISIASRLKREGQYYAEKKTMAFASLAMLSGKGYLDFPQARLMQEDDMSENRAIDWSLKQNGRRRLVYDYFSQLSNIMTSHQVLSNDRAISQVQDADEKVSEIIAFERYRGDRAWIAIVNLGHVGISNYRVGTDSSGSYRLAIDSDSLHFGGSGEFEIRMRTGTLVADAAPINGRKYSVSLPYLAPFATVLIYRE